MLPPASPWKPDRTPETIGAREVRAQRLAAVRQLARGMQQGSSSSSSLLPSEEEAEGKPLSPWDPGAPPSPVKGRQGKQESPPRRWKGAPSPDSPQQRAQDAPASGWDEAALLSKVRPDTMALANAVFDSLDSNRDGRVDAGEWEAAGGRNLRAGWA